jgi:hypothetical protein
VKSEKCGKERRREEKKEELRVGGLEEKKYVYREQNRSL